MLDHQIEFHAPRYDLPASECRRHFLLKGTVVAWQGELFNAYLAKHVTEDPVSKWTKRMRLGKVRKRSCG